MLRYKIFSGTEFHWMPTVMDEVEIPDFIAE
jgi:hypothetical protein